MSGYLFLKHNRIFSPCTFADYTRKGSSSLLVEDIILNLLFMAFCRLFIRVNKWLIKKHVEF